MKGTVLQTVRYSGDIKEVLWSLEQEVFNRSGKLEEDSTTGHLFNLNIKWPSQQPSTQNKRGLLQQSQQCVQRLSSVKRKVCSGHIHGVIETLCVRGGVCKMDFQSRSDYPISMLLISPCSLEDRQVEPFHTFLSRYFVESVPTSSYLIHFFVHMF